MAIMNLIMSATLTNWVGKLLEALYKAIGNFGWTVVVFSIILKVVLSPLDIWQRVSTKNQQKKMEAIKPKLEKLEKQYKNNPDLLKQKQYEVQREAKINVFATCLPLIVTMVVFFVVFGGFRALVTYENELIVEELDKAYVSYVLDYNVNELDDTQKDTFKSNFADCYLHSKYAEAQIEAMEDAQKEEIKNGATTKYADFLADLNIKALSSSEQNELWDVIKYFYENGTYGINSNFVEYSELEGLNPEKYAEMQNILAETYKNHLEGDRWLWVKNIFKSDTGTTVVPDSKAFTSSGAGGINASLEDTQIHTSYTNLTSPAAAELNKQGTWDFKKWNGYFILPLLSLLTSFLSTFIMQKNNPTSAVGTQEQQAQQQKQMKMMTYMMPIMLAVFAMLYSAAFAIYYFMSNIMATVTTLAVNGIMKLVDKRKEAQEQVIVR